MDPTERSRRRGLKKSRKRLAAVVAEANRSQAQFAAVSHEPARVVSATRGLRWPLSAVVSGLRDLERDAGLARRFHETRRLLLFYIEALSTAVESADRRPAGRVVVNGARRPPLGSLRDALGALTDSIGKLDGPPSEFQKNLRRLMDRSDLTAHALGREADVDATYVRRLLSGEMTKPGRGVVSDLGAALKSRSEVISDKDVGRLLKSAGYPPGGRRRKFIGLF